MPGRERIIPQEERRQLSSENNELWEDYVKKSGDPKGYYGSVKEFLEFCAFSNPKFVDQINVDDDVNPYIDTIKKHGAAIQTVNGRLSAIAGFRDYLVNERGFNEKFLSDLPSHEKTTENPTEIRPLTLKQLVYARKYNQRQVKDQYIFECFFQLEIDKNDLSNEIYPEINSPQLKNLINAFNQEKIKISLSMISSYFQRLTTYLKRQGVYDKDRRSIYSYDLQESHKVYFQKCPNCGRGPFENTSENWVLAKVRFDDESYQDEYHLVCKVCKGLQNE